MISLLKATTNLRNHSSGSSENLSSKYLSHPNILIINLCSDPNLILVEAPLLEAGEFTIDQDEIVKMNQELDEAANQELPVDEDEDFWEKQATHWV